MDAKIPEQLRQIAIDIEEIAALVDAAKTVTIGRYTLVLDGSTMASILGGTLGVATQLDRALGYGADAGGTTL